MTKPFLLLVLLSKLFSAKTPYKFEYLYDDTLSYKAVSAKFINDYEYLFTKGTDVILKTLDPENVENSSEKTIHTGCAAMLEWSYFPDDLGTNPENLEKIQYTCLDKVNQGFAGPYANSYDITILVKNSTLQFKDCQNMVWKDDGLFYVVSRGNIVKVTVEDHETSTMYFLTHDGKFDEIIYGGNDWASGVSKTMFVQNGNLYVTKADMRAVETFEFQTYETSDKTYPSMAKMKYGNPGTPNPSWEILVYDTTSNDLVETFKNPFLVNSDGYLDNGYLQQVIPGGDSTDGTDFVFGVWKNRWSNESTTIRYLSFGGVAQETILDTFVNPVGWVGVGNYQELMSYESGSEYLYSNMPYNGFNQLYRIAIEPNTSPTQFLTSGNFEVSDMNNYNPIACVVDDDSVVYYYSTLHTDGQSYQNRRFLWKQDISRSINTCLTCDIERCSDVTVQSFSCKTQVWNCAGNSNEIPMTYFYDENLENGKIQVLESNVDTVTRLNDIDFREKKYYYNQSVPEIGPEGFNFHIHYPPNFDESKSYPLLVWVYGGPGTAWVTDEFKNEWANEYLSSNHDVIVASLDSYGTPGRGTDFLYKVYKKLGYYEPLDQIAFARHLSDTFDFVDGSRMAVWGRSYGGFVTSRIMAEDYENVYKCGIIVAPVTDWAFYQSLYTERAMLSPELNHEGYANSVSWQKSENYKNHKVYMAHGTHDENVHFQNAARLEQWLVHEGVEFDSYFAADENHRFTRTKNGNQHHYKMLTRWLQECLEFE